MKKNVITSATSILTISAFTLCNAGNGLNEQSAAGFSKLRTRDVEKNIFVSTQTLTVDYISEKYKSDWMAQNFDLDDNLEFINFIQGIDIEQKYLDPDVLSLLNEFDEISSQTTPIKKRF